MATTESAVCEHGGVNWWVKHRSFIDNSRLAFTKPNSDPSCFRFSYY